MSKTRIIKKYPNRRLYDTQESRYITLAEIRQLVDEHVPFRVIERRSDTDITTAVLLQVISELESGEQRLLGPELLGQLIRAYGRGDAAAVEARLLEALGVESGTDLARSSDSHASLSQRV